MTSQLVNMIFRGRLENIKKKTDKSDKLTETNLLTCDKTIQLEFGLG